MTKQVKAIKDEFNASLFKAIERAITQMEKLPEDKKTTVRAYDVAGGIFSMLDMGPRVPRKLSKRMGALERKQERIIERLT